MNQPDMAVVVAQTDPAAATLRRVDAAIADELQRRAAAGRAAANAERLLRELVVDRTSARTVELPGLTRAAKLFHLSQFEIDVLLVALAVEIDDRYCDLFAALQGDGRLRPSIGLTLRLFAVDPIVGLAVVTDDGHLCRSGLLEVIGDGPHAGRALRISAGLWRRLIATTPDHDLFNLVAPPVALDDLVLMTATRAEAEATIAWARPQPARSIVIEVVGAVGSGRDALARAIATGLGYRTLFIDAAAHTDRGAIRSFVRETAWQVAALVVRDPDDSWFAHVIAAVATPVIVVRERRASSNDVAGRTIVTVTIARLDSTRRSELWRHALDRIVGHEVDSDRLATRFQFGPGRVMAAIDRAITSAAVARCHPITDRELELACRDVGGADRVERGHRLRGGHDLAEVIVPGSTRRELALILAWARNAATVFRDGGAGTHLTGGDGLVCLFAGPPGTGKTMAAQAIARALGLDLVRIDLSQVLNKYIGETEKHLDKVFTDAEATSAVLFFDEADALFGKRTEVRTAQDRYANVETAFLLQRLESHRGVVILATNLKRNLDDAFLRRIQIAADFPVPGPAERRDIWRLHLAKHELADDVDLEFLAGKFACAGGDIRNAAFAAVLLAADQQRPVAMQHLACGVWRELHKAGKLIQPDEFGPWRDAVIEFARGGGGVSGR